MARHIYIYIYIYIYIFKRKIEYKKTNLLFSLLITFESVSETWYKDHASVIYPGRIHAGKDDSNIQGSIL